MLNAKRIKELAQEMNGSDLAVLLYEMGYFSYRLWCREDLAAVLVEKGFSGSDENVAAVLNTGLGKHIDDCTDREWMMIEYAIDEVRASLEPLTEEEAS